MLYQCPNISRGGWCGRWVHFFRNMAQNVLNLIHLCFLLEMVWKKQLEIITKISFFFFQTEKLIKFDRKTGFYTKINKMNKILHNANNLKCILTSAWTSAIAESWLIVVLFMLLFSFQWQQRAKMEYSEFGERGKRAKKKILNSNQISFWAFNSNRVQLP